MLRIVQNKSAAGARNYYSKADYYSEGQELVGSWGGKGAEKLQLHGEVQKADFDSLCDNLHPRTGERLTARTDSDRTVGYDFNFHVPKGVSLVYSLNQDERILTAFRDSVRETMQELESEAKTRVRGKGRDENRTTGNLCWAEFVHFTARPVNGTPDPHLHAHCFTMNTTFDEKENRWKAAQFRDLKRDARYSEAAFHARFAKRLTEIGYPIERRGKGWDLASIPKNLANKFSCRTKLIEELANDKGIHDPAKKDELGAKTREKKAAQHPMQELRELWRQRLDAGEQRLIDGLSKSSRPVLVADREATSRALDNAVAHCFERNSVVPVKELLGDALRRGVGQVSVEGVKEELSRKEIITSKYRGRDLATTRTVLGEEKAMLEFARSGRRKFQPLNKGWKIRRDWLNKGQQAAVRHVIESRDAVIMVKGRAGTGKTSLMKEAVEAIEAGGKQVFTFAPSAEASRGVLAQEGFASATTVAELLVNHQLQKDAAGQVLWIDEAGLLGSRTMAQVFDLAERNNNRVILSGDWRQHGSVERGAAMRLLEQEAGVKPAVVSQNQRQESMEYRAVVDLIADGDLAAGFDRMDQLGWVREIGDAERNQLIASDYADCLAEKESVLVICPTHEEGNRISQLIRNELKSRKLIGEVDHSVKRLVPLHFTEGERGDAAAYEPGDILVFHQNAKGFRKGDRVKVEGNAPGNVITLAKHFQVYRETSFPVAINDRIRVTANGKSKEGHRLHNGSAYMVTGFLEDGSMRLDNGWLIGADHGFLAPGYVATSHASQGRTVDRVLICEPSYSFGAASREQFYVSASRGKRSARLYTNDKVALQAAIHRSSDRMSATELMNGRINDAETRQLTAARGKILAMRQPDKQPQRDWEMVYG
jgi:conjugative relaxase-like TrwC/TraI family protein